LPFFFFGFLAWPFFFFFFFFFRGLVLIGADRWFHCSGRVWIDGVCAVVEWR